jgi:hypothetical protein
MKIRKKNLKTMPICKITFELKNTDADQVFVAGDFYNWKENDFSLKNLRSVN